MRIRTLRHKQHTAPRLRFKSLVPKEAILRCKHRQRNAKRKLRKQYMQKREKRSEITPQRCCCTQGRREVFRVALVSASSAIGARALLV
jgi:hypothetical protein